MKHFFLAGILVFAFTAVLPAAAQDMQCRQVQEVLAGDRIRLVTGTEIQYASIKAPAMDSRDPVIRDYAQESKRFNETLVQGKTVCFEWAAKIRNTDGVYTPYVFFEDGTFINEQILKAGYAKLAIEPPNLKYDDRLGDIARHARQDGEGLWIHEDEKSRRIGVVANKSTKKFYYPDDPELEDMPKSHTIAFESPVRALAEGYKPSSEYRERYQQETALY